MENERNYRKKDKSSTDLEQIRKRPHGQKSKIVHQHYESEGQRFESSWARQGNQGATEIPWPFLFGYNILETHAEALPTIAILAMLPSG